MPFVNQFVLSVQQDLPSSSIRDFLLPTIWNLLKDSNALDPAHKEALEIILKERSGGTFDALRVMGAHLELASSVTSYFGESGLLGKKEVGETLAPPPDPMEPHPKPITQPPPVEDTRFRRIMNGGFSDLLRGKNKSNEDIPQSQ